MNHSKTTDNFAGTENYVETDDLVLLNPYDPFPLDEIKPTLSVNQSQMIQSTDINFASQASFSFFDEVKYCKDYEETEVFDFASSLLTDSP